MPDYKLHYFNFRGLGELIRLILHYAGVTFEDVRFERSEWPNIKPSTFLTHRELKIFKYCLAVTV